MDDQVLPRIIIIDDDELITHSVRNYLERVAQMKVIGVAPDGESGLRVIDVLRPDVVLLDIRMPLMSGRAVAEKLVQYDGVHAVVHTGYSNPFCVLCLRALGVGAFVQKGENGEVIRAAITAAARGLEYFSEMIQKTLEAAGPLDELMAESCAWASLTEREKEVARLVAAGALTRQIADSLGIAVRTVEKHRTAITAKLHARTGYEAASITTRSTMDLERRYTWPCDECERKVQEADGRAQHISL